MAATNFFLEDLGFMVEEVCLGGFANTTLQFLRILAENGWENFAE
jgi:hypothetical protein